MKSRNKAGKAWLLLATAFLITAGAERSWGAAANEKGEIACFKSLTKAISKQSEAIVKAMTACNTEVLEGAPGPCPDASTQATLDKAAAKAFSAATKKCQSACSGATALPCIASSTCPPNGILPENCTAGGKNYFEAFQRMGFPGAYCNEILGGAMRDPEDFGICVSGEDATGVDVPNPGIGELIGDSLMDNIYGDIVSPPSPGASACLASVMKAAGKTASKLAATVAKCRNAQLSADVQTVLPSRCAIDDTKTIDGLAKIMAKFHATIESNCDDSQIAELDFCDGDATTVQGAKDCLAIVLEEAGYSTAPERTYASVSIINGAYPESSLPRCGDNLINQQSNAFAFNGEECDGDQDDACPGQCFPPGDLFECTCATVARARGQADGFAADLDNGWSGKSHNSKVTDKAGFVSEVTDCDCDLFEEAKPASCVAGHSTDPVCNLFSETQPRCSTRIGDSTSCDQVGNVDGGHDKADCQSCDEFASNAGDFCTGSARFCVGGASTGVACNHVTDCPGGSCSGIGRCLTGPNVGKGCANNAACGVGNTCVKETCVGGDVDGITCAGNGDCTGGGRCGLSSDCESQCYPDGSETPTGPCAKQSDCEVGERCKGICDTTPTCVILRNGAPLPLSANGTSVCIDSRFFTNITGTRNIYTGEHALDYELRSVIFLAGNNELNSRPCPVCGGFCEGAIGDSFRCEGTCTGVEKQCRFGTNIGDPCTTNADCEGEMCTGVACRFDEDCPSGTCSGLNSPECATHGPTGTCRLDLACGGGTKPGQSCRLEAYTAFGTTSSDCPMSGSNIAGDGLAISWTPLTSGAVVNEEPNACDSPDYENYECNCVRGGGATRNLPNGCDAACTDPDPDYFGKACNALTTCIGDACVGGTNDGNVCATNADCPGLNAACSVGGFKACIGSDVLCTQDTDCGPGVRCTFRGHGNGRACDEDSDCATGDCGGNPRVCGDGSTGECTIRRCSGGTNPGQICTQNSACLGGGSCPVAAACQVGGAPCTEGQCKSAACEIDATCDNGAVCEDACPNGRCTPMCLPRGVCNGGDRDGDFCALDSQCVGGGTCVPDDPEEGSCANGSFNHCDGPGWQFKLCLPGDVNTQKNCQGGVNGIVGDADDNPGAGFCRADVSNCFINDGASEGGTTANLKGDATNTYSVATFCIPASSSDAVNSTAGLPGPGRIRQPSVVIPNYDQLPIPAP